MKIIPPVMGAGQIYGDILLRGNKSYTDFADAVTKTGIELQFYSNSEELVGIIGSQYEKSSMGKFELKEKLIGGVESFKFSTGRIIDLPFFDGMQVRLNYNGVHWFTMILVWKPGQDRRDVEFEFQGKGYSDYLKRITVKELYINETVTDILIDLITNYMTVYSPIIYNPEKLNLPDITVSRIELNNKTLDKAFETILEICNFDYTNTQYRYYIDKYRQLNWEPISNDILYGFFEGFQYQDPDTEYDISQLFNVIKIYRAIEDTNDVRYIAGSDQEDADSINTWGERIYKLTIADFVDTTTAELIARAFLESHKNPILKIEGKNLRIEDLPYNFGFYMLNNRYTQYILEVSDFEDLTAWDLFIANTVITEFTQKSISKNQCFQCELNTGSNGEYIEFELEEAIYFPEKLILYINQSLPGEFLDIFVYDEDGEEEDLGYLIYIITQGQDKIISQEGAYLIAQQNALDINLTDSFGRFEFLITILNNIKKIKIKFVSNENVTIYLDRLDIQAKIWKQNKLIANEFMYKVDKANFMIDCNFGQKTINFLDDIKEIGKNQQYIYDIFQKEV